MQNRNHLQCLVTLLEINGEKLETNHKETASVTSPSCLFIYVSFMIDVSIVILTVTGQD